MEISLGTVIVKPPGETKPKLSLMLWGPAGAGKTTLAATAPGHKLWILFDQGGCDPIAARSDIMVADFSGEKYNITEKFKDDNPFGLEKVLDDHPEIETIVFDSITAYTLLCTEAAVKALDKSTIEQPGLQGYGYRNARVLRAMVSLMRLAKRKGRHFIMIGHEDSPEKNDKGVVLFITVAIGGKMTNQIGLQLGEVWNMTQVEGAKGEHRIAVRPCRLRQPMKSRMFDLSGEPEFVWKYDPINDEGMKISTWLEEYERGNFRKIKLPKA